MAKNLWLSKEVEKWFKDHGQKSNKAIQKIPISASYIKPGDVILLTYPEDYDYRLVLVVANKSGQGIYTSTAGNILLSGFKLTDSKIINKIVLEFFYKKESAALYENFKSPLNAIFGNLAYRTYNFSKIRELYKVTIDISKIEIDEDED